MLGLVLPTVQTVPSSGLPPKADFSSPGSAIAYCAYSFPDTLVRATFRDYYLTLAVLNTIVSTGLSCYSRYLAAVSQAGGGGASCVPPQTVGGDSARGTGSPGLGSAWTSCGWARPASGARSPCSRSGPHDPEGLV